MQNTDGSTARTPGRATGIRVLIADDDAHVRSLFGTLLREIDGVFAVVEAEDGARAVDLSRELHVDVAILDLNMPRLDGVQAAQILLALQPSIGIALHSTDPDSLHARAAGLGLPLFDKLELDALVEWVKRQAQGHLSRRRLSTLPRVELVCTQCGYGIVTATPPPHCPMCHAVVNWTEPHRARHDATRKHAVG